MDVPPLKMYGTILVWCTISFPFPGWNRIAPACSLVAGDVNGKFSSFFSRIETVNSKNGPFDMLLVAGMQQNESTRLALFPPSFRCTIN
jgi:hypothetical protein